MADPRAAPAGPSASPNVPAAPPTQCGGGRSRGITAAVPPSVWTVRLRRAAAGRFHLGGRSHTRARGWSRWRVRAVPSPPHAPRRIPDGSLIAAGKVVRVVKLTETRCEVEGGPHEGPTFVPLANGSTPGGEPFRIEGVLVHAGHHQTFFNLSLEADVEGRTNESHAEGPIGQTRRPFSWSLTTGCPPHSFSIIYGTLAAPGVSVSALTPAGLIPLTEMQLAANLHAAGPLFYAALDGALRARRQGQQWPDALHRKRRRKGQGRPRILRRLRRRSLRLAVVRN